MVLGLEEQIQRIQETHKGLRVGTDCSCGYDIAMRHRRSISNPEILHALMLILPAVFTSRSSVLSSIVLLLSQITVAFRLL